MMWGTSPVEGMPSRGQRGYGHCHPIPDKLSSVSITTSPQWQPTIGLSLIGVGCVVTNAMSVTTTVAQEDQSREQKTVATAELDAETLALIDDRAADEHMTDPEAIREVALDHVDRVELVTEAGEPIGEALARDPQE